MSTRTISNSNNIMDQDDLFELQNLIAELTLNVAKKEGKTDDLLKDFGWLYKSEWNITYIWRDLKWLSLV